MIYVIGMNDTVPADAIEVNTTSRSSEWKGLSPFHLGPCPLYDGLTSRNVENLWQFSKVYAPHTDEAGEPTEEYWEWARKGWNDTWAHRYPMGKGAVPKYSLWDGRKYNYIDARKIIYLPSYRDAVKGSGAFGRLKELSGQGKDIYLRDFDGYNHQDLGWSYDEVINCRSRKMGHAFILAMMLDNYYLTRT